MPSFESGAVRSGLKPFKLDLHVHTPASHDWNGGEVTAADVVGAAIAAGLDGIAVTDHSNPTWIDQVKEAANGSALTVFPGVEVNGLAGNDGIHLIVLFRSGLLRPISIDSSARSERFQDWVTSAIADHRPKVILRLLMLLLNSR